MKNELVSLQSTFFSSARFDWFCASVLCDVQVFVDAAKLFFDCDIEHIPPRSGYRYAVKFFKGSLVHLVLMWDGPNVGDRLYVLASGFESNALRDWLVVNYPDSYLLRADVCLDIDEPDSFSSLYNLSLIASRKFRLRTANAGDWANKIQGRTFYVGSRQSPAFLRLYEKGKQLLNGSDDHSRFEFEFKPKNSSARLHWFSQSPSDFFSFNPWVSFVFSQLCSSDILPSSVLAGTDRHKDSSHDRAMHFLIKQYRNTIINELKINGGDYVLLIDRLAGAVPSFDVPRETLSDALDRLIPSTLNLNLN